tara:strand:+ start:7208 stop:9157 length:1950 start_codon:yes stop_codon:yes gene_type:complete
MARRHDIETRLTAKDKTKAAFNRVQKRMKSLKKASLVAGGGIAAIGAGLVMASKRAVNFGDDIAKTARQLDISTKAFQEMRLAVDLAGVSEEKFGSGLGKLARNIGDFREGTGTLVTFLDKLGDKSFANLLKKTTDTEQAFKVFIKRMDQAANQQQKLALANAAFGRGVGQALAGMSFAELEKGIKIAREFGVVIDEKLLKEAEKIKDTFTIVGAVFKKEFFSALLAQLKSMDLKTFAMDMAKLAVATVDFVRATAEFFGIITTKDNFLELVGKRKKAFEQLQRHKVKFASQIAMDRPTTDTEEWIAVRRKRLEFLDKEINKLKELNGLNKGGPKKPLRVNMPPPKVMLGDDDVFMKDAKATKISVLFDKLMAYRDGLAQTNSALSTLNSTSFESVAAMDSEIQRLETAKKIRKFINDLKIEGLPINEQTVKATINEANAVDVLNRKLQKKKELLQPGPIQEYMNNIQSLSISLEHAAVRGADALTDSLVGLMNHTTSAKEAFRAFAFSIIKDLQRIMVKKLIVDRIMGWAMSAMAPAATGSYAPDGSPNPFLVDKAATGGSIGTGRATLVGERGPELMVPRRNAHIIPNSALGGGGTSIVNNYDFSGANPATIMALRQEADRIKQDTFASVFGAIDRGGSYARVSGRR